MSCQFLAEGAVLLPSSVLLIPNAAQRRFEISWIGNCFVVNTLVDCQSNRYIRLIESFVNLFSYYFKGMKMIYSKLFFAAFVTCFYFTSPAQVIKSIQLPAPQKDIGKPLMQVLNSRQSTRVFTTKQLPIQEISNLLWAAFGINRTDEGKRTAPSARNWQDIDIYVFLPEGVYIYKAKDNKLEQISNVDLRSLAGVQDFVKTAPLNLVYVSDQSKMETASKEDKMMYSGADAGFIAQNVYLYCASQDLGVVVRAMVDKKTLAEKLNLKQGQVIVLAQTIGYKK